MVGSRGCRCGGVDAAARLGETTSACASSLAQNVTIQPPSHATNNVLLQDEMALTGSRDHTCTTRLVCRSTAMRAQYPIALTRTGPPPGGSIDEDYTTNTG